MQIATYSFFLNIFIKKIYQKESRKGCLNDHKQGKTFCNVYGTADTIIEQFLVKNSLKIPQWVELTKSSNLFLVTILLNFLHYTLSFFETSFTFWHKHAKFIRIFIYINHIIFNSQKI